MQDAVAVVGDLAAGQDGTIGEADQLGPCNQVGGGEDAFQPGVVLRGVLAWQVAKTRGFGLADAVFDAGVTAVAQFQDR